MKTLLFWNIAKNYKYTPKYSENFWSGNWKFWSNLRALTTVSLQFFYKFSQTGVPLDMNNYFRGSSAEKSLRNVDLSKYSNPSQAAVFPAAGFSLKRPFFLASARTGTPLKWHSKWHTRHNRVLFLIPYSHLYSLVLHAQHICFLAGKLANIQEDSSVFWVVTPGNNTENGRIHFNRGGSLRSRKIQKSPF